MSSIKGRTDKGLQKQTSSSEFSKPATKRTPEVYLDVNKGEFRISGRSMPVRPNDFYFLILRNIERYIENPANTTNVTFQLEYVDSASSKLLLALVMRLKKIKEKNDLHIKWFYTEDDHDIYELGKTFSELSGCEFELAELE